MKKLTFLLLVMTLLITTGSSRLSAGNPLKSVKGNVATHSQPNEKTRKQFANFSLSLSRGSNVSGEWVIQLSGSAGTFQYAFNNTTIVIPSGTYQVGIYRAGGSSTSYSISGSVCTINYSTFSTSAVFSNVTCTCGSGSFSIN